MMVSLMPGLPERVMTLRGQVGDWRAVASASLQATAIGVRMGPMAQLSALHDG
jgi:hypothetical protein